MVSWDAATRKARFIRAGSQVDRLRPAIQADWGTAARVHLLRHSALLGVSEAELRQVPVSTVHTMADGASVVQFEQNVDGIPVFRSRASVVLDAKKNLVSIGSTLHATMVPDALSTRALRVKTFDLSPEKAMSKAYADKYRREPKAVRDNGARSGSMRGYSVITPSGDARVSEATAKRVWFPEGPALLPAYYIEFLAREQGDKENKAYGYVVGAADGRVLHRQSLTQNEAFQYRVWAEADGNHIPMDGPMVDYSPHPTGAPDKSVPGYRPPNLVSMEGFNKNPDGRADPWLAAIDTVTFGNNVRAYSDRNDTHEQDADGRTIGDGYDDGVDLRGEITGPMTFDRTYDIEQEPNSNPEQIKAAVTQMFYVTNWLHDYWYDSGFNEAAGNAQLSNYGRGGVEGDPFLAQAQDGADNGYMNNANMATFAEGTSPRMQMFVWSGVPNRKVETTPALTFDDGYGAAVYGPQEFDKSGTIVLSDDGVNTPSDGCQKPTNVAGKIAIIDRGTCDFISKGKNAQAGGAIGIILLNNVEGHVPPNPGLDDPTIKIPLVSLSKEDGQKLKDALAQGAVQGSIFRGPEVLHDGTIDNTIIAHEWGHYLHHRLVVCGSLSCGGMSEGWADFNALMMSIRPGDSFDGRVFPLAQYAAAGLFPNASYFGIRRAPYSTDMAKNPFTFQHIRWRSELPTTAPLQPASPDMSEVHNVGEIWAQTLFDAYANLQKAGQAATPPRTFEESKRRMADYLVAGMKATPVEPTFAEQRDAILGAVWATGRREDFDALAQGFAKRGLGVGAVAPPTDSYTLDEAVESFSTGGDFAFVDATMDDSGSSCDRDGVLDSGETGKLVVRVRNSGWAALTGTTISVSSTEPSIFFGSPGEPATATIASMGPFEVMEATINVTADRTRLARTSVPIQITLTNDAAASKTLEATANVLYNFDDVPKSSVSDNAESATTAWTFLHGPKPIESWFRTGGTQNHVWHGSDVGVASDESLVSPDLVVGSGDFSVTFDHRFYFESGAAVPGGPEVFFDGAVFELSEDGGTTWKDVSEYIDPKYPLTVYESAEGKNVLSGRKAWAGQSAKYPEYVPVVLKFGKVLAGKTIRVRFRVGCDVSVGAPGWDIDNLTFSGITNLPFPTVVDDRRACVVTTPPDAGTDAGKGGAADGGGGGNPGGGGGGGGGGPTFPESDAGSPTNPTDPGGGGDDDGGCATSPVRAPGTQGLALLLGGGLLMFLRRVTSRRRR
ncbi:M36 family metallopeptidase [Pendulispora brunnea]|uniref:M36 family metallopeptidase n=1 Tax=Pendulispora brunnea TaxID=2905690 RepID=A0ABZ2KNG5_9BACT